MVTRAHVFPGLVGATGLLLLLCSCSGDDPIRRTPLVAPAPTEPDEPAEPALGGPPEGTPYDLTILYTNDLHAQVTPRGARSLGGLARQATLLRLLREQASQRHVALLTINAGDSFEGTLFHELDGGAFTLRLLEHLGYDVHQVGNHDHQFGVQYLYDTITRAFQGPPASLRFTYGNVNPESLDATGTLPQLPVSWEVIAAFENGFASLDPGHLDPGRMDPLLSNAHLFNQSLGYEREGIRIGLFGVCNDEILYNGVPGPGNLFPDPEHQSEFLTFYDPVSAPYVAEMVAYLENPDGDPATDDGADVIICVSHLGLERDLELVASAMAPSGRAIDVLVGGHSHHRLNTALPVPVAGGGETLVVQAGALGAFLGRLDLALDPVAGGVTPIGCELLQVDASVPDDPGTLTLIEQEITRPGGLDDHFDHPFDRVVAHSQLYLPGDEHNAPSALGNLAADAALSATAGQGVEIVLLGSFLFRADLEVGPVTPAQVAEIFPLHVLDTTGSHPDTLQVLDLGGGLVNAVNLAALVDPEQPSLILGLSRLEYFLEIIYSLSDLITVLAGDTDLPVAGLSSFIDGLQWDGVEFTVDHEGPLFQRIDPATILVQDVPLVGREEEDRRLAISGVLAQVALPLVQGLSQVENPPGSGLREPLFQYDPSTADTGLLLREVLAARLEHLGTLEAAATTARPAVHSLGPDLYLHPPEGTLTPASAGPGTSVELTLPIHNAGRTGASATLEVALDPTPHRLTDNPDRWTDTLTGATELVVARRPTGSVPAAGSTLLVETLTLPVTLTPGPHRLEVRLVEVLPEDPSHPERITGNNRSPGLFLPLQIQ